MVRRGTAREVMVHPGLRQTTSTRSEVKINGEKNDTETTLCTSTKTKDASAQ